MKREELEALGLTKEQVDKVLNMHHGELDPVQKELNSAKEALLSSLRGTHDSPGAIESYYSTGALSGMGMTPEAYMEKVNAVTVEQVAEAARTLNLHTTYFLKGVTQ